MGNLHKNNPNHIKPSKTVYLIIYQPNTYKEQIYKEILTINHTEMCSEVLPAPASDRSIPSDSYTGSSMILEHPKKATNKQVPINLGSSTFVSLYNNQLSSCEKYHISHFPLNYVQQLVGNALLFEEEDIQASSSYLAQFFLVII